jgi:hypothetical protein
MIEQNQVEELKQFGKALTVFAQDIAENLTPIFQQLKPAIQELYDCFWEIYLKAGAPYGETDDGMMRWYREIGEAKRLQYQADRIIQNHQMLASFRQTVKNNEPKRLS